MDAEHVAPTELDLVLLPASYKHPRSYGAIFISSGIHVELFGLVLTFAFYLFTFTFQRQTPRSTAKRRHSPGTFSRA